jgi:hypothetical protein
MDQYGVRYCIYGKIKYDDIEKIIDISIEEYAEDINFFEDHISIADSGAAYGHIRGLDDFLTKNKIKHTRWSEAHYEFREYFNVFDGAEEKVYAAHDGEIALSLEKMQDLIKKGPLVTFRTVGKLVKIGSEKEALTIPDKEIDDVDSFITSLIEEKQAQNKVK